LNRVGALFYREMEHRAGRLGRALETTARGIVEPAVIGAGDAALLDSAVEQRGASVGAMVGDKTHPPTLILEENEILAEDADEFRRLLVRQLGHEADWLPVAAEQFSARGAGSHAS